MWPSGCNSTLRRPSGLRPGGGATSRLPPGQSKGLASVAVVLSSRCHRYLLATSPSSLPQPHLAEPERWCPSCKNLSQILDIPVVLKPLFGEGMLMEQELLKQTPLT